MTVGSPLSKADVLLAYDEQALEQKKQRREAPTSPPVFEVDKPGVDGGVYRFSFPADAEVRIPHHAAVFAPVVWTNIYFPSFAIVFGDMISGECAPQLGRGIRDIKLRIGGPVFRHLDYWKGAERTPARQDHSVAQGREPTPPKRGSTLAVAEKRRRRALR